MRKRFSMSLLSAYSMLLASLGLGAATHARGETLHAILAEAKQQVAPETDPVVRVFGKKWEDAELL